MTASATASPWATLLPAALAGTRRQVPPAVPGFTPGLGSEPNAPEKTLLLTAANLRLVERAGRQSTPNDGARAFAPAAETLPEIGPAATELLAQLLRTEGSWRFVKLKHFLRLLRQHQQRIPYRLLRPLADVLLEPNQMFLFRMLLDGLGGLGNRGQALLLALGKKPLGEWTRQLDAGWTPGVPAHAQSGALGELARQGPHGQAVAMADLFKELVNWKEWPEYEAVWWVLRQWVADGPLPPEAGPLLDGLVQQYKWIPGGGRRLAYHHDLAGLRAAMPDSDLAERCWQLARPYLALDLTADNPPRLRFELLPTWRDPSQHPRLSEDDRRDRSAWEVGEWLALVPPSRWAAAWHLTAEQAVAAAAASKREAMTVLPAWARAAVIYGEGDFLAAVVGHYRQRLQNKQSGGSGVLPRFTFLRDADLLTWLRLLAPELPLPPDIELSDPWRENWGSTLTEAANRYSPALLRSLLPLLAASQQPGPHPGSAALALSLYHSLHAYAHCPDLTILPELQAAFAFDAPPFLADTLAEVVEVLQLARDFEAALLAPAAG